VTARVPVFLDRDGVINRNREDYVKTAEEWVPIPGAMEAIARLSREGFPVVVLTNQSAIGRGYCSEETVKVIHRRMKALVEESGGRISGVYYCPHRPDENCSCRKPATGMIRRARAELDLAEGGYMVGDAESDMEMGRRDGLKTVMVLTGRGRSQLDMIRSAGERMPWKVVRDLSRAAEIIVQDSKSSSSTI